MDLDRWGCAGDLRRALAAAERLCILLGDEGPLERRDVAVLYLHACNFPAASAHLAAYTATSIAAGAYPVLELLIPSNY